VLLTKVQEILPQHKNISFPIEWKKLKLKSVPYPIQGVGDMPIEGMNPEPRDIAAGWPVPFCPALTSQPKPVLIYS